MMVLFKRRGPFSGVLDNRHAIKPYMSSVEVCQLRTENQVIFSEAPRHWELCVEVLV